MLGREELTSYDCNEDSYDSMGFPWQYKEMVYDKDKADKVMDAMESRIKELEEKLSNEIAIRDRALKTNEELIKNLARTCREYTQYNLNLQHHIDAQNARIKELEATISILER